MSEIIKNEQDDIESLTVNLLNKEFTFRCSGEQAAKLRQASTYLNDKMLVISNHDRTRGFESVAVMAAINLCAELIENQSSSINKRKIVQRLEQLQGRIESVLQTEEQLELTLI